MSGPADAWRQIGQSLLDYALFVLDRQVNITQWSVGAAELYSYVAADVIGRHFALLYTDDGRHAEQPRIVLQRLAAEGRYEEDGWQRRCDGSTF